MSAVEFMPDHAEESALFYIPGHEVREEIARGGMGIVYRARQHDPERDVALKMLLPGGSTPVLRERFRMEARAMAELDHPGVLPLYQFGEHGGTPWFTMKLATGGTLAERLHSSDGSRAFSPAAAAGLMAQIAEAVAYAHQRGVLHRDLKPGNILFDADGRACVADFGLAKLDSQSAAGLTHSRAMLGTPHYLAPELAAKFGASATVATDVYALGAILYEMLSGRPPFQSETLAGLLRSIAEDEPPSLLLSRTGEPDRVPRGLAAIAGKAMARDPARRYRDAAAFAADLKSWLAGDAIEARPPSGMERGLRWLRRHPAWAASLVALVVAVSAVIFLQARAGAALRVEKAAAEASEAKAQAARGDALAAQVAAARAGGQLDLRNSALKAAREAASFKVTDQLRNDAITLLATPGWHFMGIRSAGDCYSVPLSPGHEVIANLTDGRLVLRELSGAQTEHTAPPAPDTLNSIVRITARAEKVLVRGRDDAHFLYDRVKRSWVREWRARAWGMALSPAEDRLAWGVDKKSEVVVEKLDRDGEAARLTSSFAQPVPLSFSPDGLMLAVGGIDEGGVEIFELNTGSIKHRLDTTVKHDFLPRTAWRFDSRAITLAVGVPDILIYSLEGSTPFRVRMGGHQAEVTDVSWHPDGRWIASCAFDRTVRVWQSASRREVMRLPISASAVRFSQDGRELVCFDSAGRQMYHYQFQVPTCTVFCPLPGSSGDVHRQRPPWGCALSADGMLGLTSSIYGLQYFDAVTGERLGFQSAGHPYEILLNPGGDFLFAGGESGLRRLPLRRTSVGGHELILTGRKKDPLVDGQITRMGWSEKRQRLAFTRNGKVGFVDHPGEPKQSAITELRGSPFAMNPVTISPDGRWVVSSAGDGGNTGLFIWDADRPGLPRVLPGYPRFTQCRFSPDSSRLYAHSERSLTALAADSLEVLWTQPPRSRGETLHQLCLSGDGKLLAAALPPAAIGLFEAATGRPLAVLDHPDAGFTGWLAMDHCGSRLVVTALPDSVTSWDLRELRRQLKELGLDWEMPPYPPAPEHKSLTLRFLPDMLYR